MSRIVGFVALQDPPRRIEKWLYYLPYGIFAAIVVSGVVDSTAAGLDVRVLAVTVTGVAAWLRWPFLVTLAIGAGVFLLFRAMS